MNYQFEPADNTSLEDIYRLIRNRIRWMDQSGIRQWNVTNYWDAYPETYYQTQLRQGRLYVLRRGDNRKIAGAAVILEHDRRWLNDAGIPSYYIHNFVTDIEEKGAGRIILKEVAKMALKNGKQCIRLECAADNGRLNSYYERQGFVLVGQCVEGCYQGNKREKKLV